MFVCVCVCVFVCLMNTNPMSHAENKGVAGVGVADEVGVAG